MLLFITSNNHVFNSSTKIVVVSQFSVNKLALRKNQCYIETTINPVLEKTLLETNYIIVSNNFFYKTNICCKFHIFSSILVFPLSCKQSRI